ncbi:Cerato-platanin [Rhizopogon vinicolor AM-OR11-026]|uniref:Cerato-platanin n=1 Tax=Rhizopogon vinicolor AM-OR11-026 TaxID=1314800 RepID=A0A1B7MVT8_9AGAM|nr:Cerato-platanin [Rhizopogon vinicolor AM-OR11-026]
MIENSMRLTEIVILTQLDPAFSSLPGFPYIGGAPQITGFGSANCGTCWSISYANPATPRLTTTIIAAAIDVGDPARDGFNLSLEAVNALTGGQAVQLGRVTVTATQVSRSVCGLNW